MKIVQHLRAQLWGLNKRYPWGKHMAILILGILYVLFFSNYTFTDYYKLKERSREIEEEIQALEPRFREDSTRLEKLKQQGSEVEAIAREQYLMKAPGEQIFIIKRDTTTKRNNE